MESTERVAVKKIQNTITTCMSVCGENCKQETIERLRDKVAALFDEALKEGRKQ
jgi:hypothetical protein